MLPETGTFEKVPWPCRPDLTSRVFKLKLDELLTDLTKRHILGRVTGYMYTVEFKSAACRMRTYF